MPIMTKLECEYCGTYTVLTDAYADDIEGYCKRAGWLRTEYVDGPCHRVRCFCCEKCRDRYYGQCKPRTYTPNGDEKTNTNQARPNLNCRFLDDEAYVSCLECPYTDSCATYSIWHRSNARWHTTHSE